MGGKRIVAGLLFLTLAFTAFAMGLFGYRQADRPDEAFARVWDRPLLATKHQVWEAQTTGRCSFHCGDECYVVEKLPREYVEYSRNYSRMM